MVLYYWYVLVLQEKRTVLKEIVRNLLVVLV